MLIPREAVKYWFFFWMDSLPDLEPLRSASSSLAKKTSKEKSCKVILIISESGKAGWMVTSGALTRVTRRRSGLTPKSFRNAARVRKTLQPLLRVYIKCGITFSAKVHPKTALLIQLKLRFIWNRTTVLGKLVLKVTVNKMDLQV